MPHYKDGTEAHVGDHVTGKGYNVKDENGDLKTIAGTVIALTPDADQCNVQVAYWSVGQVVGPLAPPQGVRVLSDGKLATPTIEYGQANHFEKV